nr:hypothetical protein [Tanacetum cinerariifolium]
MSKVSSLCIVFFLATLLVIASGCAPAPAPAGYRRRDVDPLCSGDDDCKARCPYSPYPYCDLSTNKCICAKCTKPPRRDNA